MDREVEIIRKTIEILRKYCNPFKIFLFGSRAEGNNHCHAGIEVKTPKESLREAFRVWWIKEEKIFLDMLEEGNKTSHIYDKETSEEIFLRIKNNYLCGIKDVLNELKKSEHL